MTTKVHDHFNKQYIAYLLEPTGQVEISREIRGHALQVDLLFTPPTTPQVDVSALGLLGQMVSRTPSLLEFFWKQPSKPDLRTCLVKLYGFHNELHNQARSQKQSLPDETLPHLWILTTAASKAFLDGFKAESKASPWCSGIYWFGDSFKTAIVAINQLPLTPDTLWLRLLGKGNVRQQALTELLALPEDHPFRNRVLELINNYLAEIEKQSQFTNENQELAMELSPAYLQWREETLQKGRLEDRRLWVENLLKSRFGSLDDALRNVIDPLLRLSPEESSNFFFQLSRDEFLAKFGSPSKPSRLPKPSRVRKTKPAKAKPTKE